MPWIQDWKNADGKKGYIVGWRDPVTKKKVYSDVIHSRDHAEHLRSTMRLRISAGRAGAPVDITWLEFEEEYLQDARTRLKAGTFAYITAPAIRQFGQFVGRADLKILTLKQVEAFRDKLLELGYSPATVAMRVRNVRTAFTYAVKHGYLAHNPATGIKPPHQDPVGRALSDHEIRKLQAAAEPPLAQVIRRQLDLGLRIGEYLAARGEHVRRRAGGVVLKVGHSPETGTKAGKARDVQLLDRNTERDAGRLPARGPLSPYTRRILQRKLAAAAKKAGIGRVRFHDLRHSSATRAAEILDPFQLKLRYGWEDLKTAERYIHVAREGNLLQPRLRLPRMRPESRRPRSR